MLFEFTIWQSDMRDESEFTTQGVVVAKDSGEAIEKIFTFYCSQQCPIIGIDFNQLDATLPYTI